VSIDSKADIETVIRTTKSGALEVLFNALHQETRGAFAEAAERGVGLIVKVPLDSGWLSGKYDANSRFMGVRDRWSPAQISRRAELVEELKGLLPPELSLRDAALQFILAHPEVSTIIPGARTIEQVDQNCRAAEQVMSPEIVSAIQALWVRELQDSPVPW